MQRLLLLAFWMASATAANQAWAAMATEETFIDDMVIVEASDSRVTREAVEVEDVEVEDSSREGRQFFWGTGSMYPGGFVMQSWYPVARVVQQQQQMLQQQQQMGNTCYTAQGSMGSCVSPKSCYSLLYNLPKNLPSWALGTKDSCIVQNAQPDSMGYTSSYGVCCSTPHNRAQFSPQRQYPGYPAGTMPFIPGQFGGGGLYPGMGGQYPQQGGYPPQQGGYPPQQGGYPPQQGGYPPQQGGYPPQQGGYPPQPPQQPVAPQAPQPPPQPVAPQPPQQAGSPAVEVVGEEPAPAPPATGGGDYNRCGVGRNAIQYNEDGEEVEQIQRINGQHPLRVAGGWPADKNEWPWIVMMMNRGTQFCDGSIIDEYHVLTAAHCVAQMRASDVASLTVRAGAHNLKNSARETGVQDVGVKLVVKHKDFTMQTLHSDIAILVLKEPFQFTPTVRKVCLPSAGDDYAKERGTVVGWGLLREGGSRPTVLQELTMEIWDNEKCSSTYGSTAPAGIKESMMCAGQKGKDSCSGDSGGPFVIPKGDHWEQIGVVSWGIGCGKDIYPGVYTRVTSMLDWIAKVRNLYPK